MHKLGEDLDAVITTVASEDDKLGVGIMTIVLADGCVIDSTLMDYL